MNGTGWLAACVCALMLSFGMGQAQTLDQTSWDERITLQVGDQLQEILGLSLDSPDDIEDSLTVTGWGASGYVTYQPPGAPRFTAHVFGKYLGGGPNIMGQGVAESRSVVTFQFAIRRILAPPVAVSDVPYSIIAHGSTLIRGTGLCGSGVCFIAGDPTGFAHLLIRYEGVTLVDRTITSAGPTPSDRTLNFYEAHIAAPDIVVNGSVEAFGQVRMNTLTPGQWSEATATIVPDFQVSPALIPGTYSKYSDYFQIEYGPGYWALGNPTSVRPTTWGKIKTLYSNP